MSCSMSRIGLSAIPTRCSSITDWSPRGSYQGTFPACGYTTLYYQLRRNLPSARDARDTLLEWHQHLVLLPFTDRMALAAHRLSMPDFEDACVAITALEGQCAVIVTRNIPDFQASPIPALTPTDLLAQL